MIVQCPKCNKIFQADGWPCPNCQHDGSRLEPRTVFDLDPIDAERVYAREIWHPKIDMELH